MIDDEKGVKTLDPFTELKRRVRNNVDMYEQKVTEAYNELRKAEAILKTARDMENNIEKWITDLTKAK